MRLQLAGFVILVACGLALGEGRARRYTMRHRDLCAMRHALVLLETYVSKTAQPFPRAIATVGLSIGGTVGYLLMRTSEVLTSDPHITLSQGWSRAIEEVTRGRFVPVAYTAADLEALGRLFGALGAGGRDDQVSHIRLAREALAMNEESARRDLETYPKLWRYLGALGAAVLGLLVI